MLLGSFIFSRYIAQKFIKSISLLFLIILTIIILISSLEIIKNIHGKEVALDIIIKLILFKCPSIIHKAFPFITLLGSIYCFYQLNKSSELIIARSVGISAWGFIKPTIFVIFIIGVVEITIFNPIAASLLSKHEKLVVKYLKGNLNVSIISNNEKNIWLREQNQFNNFIIEAKSLYHKELILYDVNFFLLDINGNFYQRIHAKSASLANGYWLLEQVNLFNSANLRSDYQDYKIKTELNLNNIQDSFASADTISFWELTSFIKTLTAAGFSAKKYYLSFYSALIRPIFLCAMVLIAISFSLVSPKNNYLNISIAAGIIIGFTIYILSNITSALGLAGKLPISLSVSAPVIITLFLAITLIFHYEDG